MGLKRLLVLEALSVILVVFVSIYIVGLNPTLESSQRDIFLGLFKEVDYGQNTIALRRGYTGRGSFFYQSYEPVILRLEIVSSVPTTAGYVEVYCNARFVANILFASPNGRASLSVVSCAGVDWVIPLQSNVISFVSGYTNGYEGTITYRISLRGTR